jgi:hypothetical protein
MVLDGYIQAFRALHAEGKAIPLVLDGIHPKFCTGERTRFTSIGRAYMETIPIPSLYELPYSHIDLLPIPDKLKSNIQMYKVLGMCFTTSLSFFYLMGMQDLDGNPYEIRKWISSKDKTINHTWLYSQSEGIVDVTKQQIPLLASDPQDIYDNHKTLKTLYGWTHGTKKIYIQGQGIRIGKSDYKYIGYLTRLISKKTKL